MVSFNKLFWPTNACPMAGLKGWIELRAIAENVESGLGVR